MDLEIDVTAPLPDDAETVRICVTGGPARAFGAADGRFALTGLDPDAAPEVTIDVLDAAGDVAHRAGPVTAEVPFVEVDLAACDGCAPCIGGGAPAPDAITLGVRFYQ